jgi:hypothetical protein
MSDPNGLLVTVVATVVGLASIIPCVHAYTAWFHRHLVPPAAAGARAPRRGRASRPVVSPAAGDPAAEAASPDVCASAAEENQR